MHFLDAMDQESHDFSKDFHVFSVTWDETTISWAVGDRHFPTILHQPNYTERAP